jgi:hypothetical protein
VTARAFAVAAVVALLLPLPPLWRAPPSYPRTGSLRRFRSSAGQVRPGEIRTSWLVLRSRPKGSLREGSCFSSGVGVGGDTSEAPTSRKEREKWGTRRQWFPPLRRERAKMGHPRLWLRRAKSKAAGRSARSEMGQPTTGDFQGSFISLWYWFWLAVELSSLRRWRLFFEDWCETSRFLDDGCGGGIAFGLALWARGGQI